MVKRKAFLVLRLVSFISGMGISKKQRGYFLPDLTCHSEIFKFVQNALPVGRRKSQRSHDSTLPAPTPVLPPHPQEDLSVP